MAAAEGAEVGMFGGPVGALVGAGIGAAAGLALAFRNRESTEQDHFLDAQTLNGQNASVRPIRPRFVTALDQRERNPGALRPRRHENAPAYYRMDEDDDVPADYKPGRAQEP